MDFLFELGIIALIGWAVYKQVKAPKPSPSPIVVSGPDGFGKSTATTAYLVAAVPLLLGLLQGWPYGVLGIIDGLGFGLSLSFGVLFYYFAKRRDNSKLPVLFAWLMLSPILLGPIALSIATNIYPIRNSEWGAVSVASLIWVPFAIGMFVIVPVSLSYYRRKRLTWVAEGESLNPDEVSARVKADVAKRKRTNAKTSIIFGSILTVYGVWSTFVGLVMNSGADSSLMPAALLVNGTGAGIAAIAWGIYRLRKQKAAQDSE